MSEFIENAGIVILFACLAAATVCGAMSIHWFRRIQKAEREAARYERQERYRQAIKAHRDSDARIMVQWMHVKIADVRREKDAEWIARVLVMERNSATGRVSYRHQETSAIVGWI